MADRKEVRKPREGLSTLVAQFTFLHFEPAIDGVRQRRAEGATEAEILKHIATAHSDFDEPTRKKIYQLSLDLLPHDDIRPEHVQSRTDVSETTIELQLQDFETELEAGGVVFFEGRRWVVTAFRSALLRLKHF